MSKLSFNKFISLFLLLILLTIIKRWFDYSYAFLWLGAIFGFYLPFVDHLFYAYIVRPDLEVSGNIKALMRPKTIGRLISFVNETKDQRERLIIHTAYFQVVFLLLTLYVLTSSGNLLGRGLVYGFSFSLFVEELILFRKTGELKSWFSQIPILLDHHETKVYIYANVLVLLIFTLML